MPDNSTKPYLIRAIYQWCLDNGFAPHLSVVVDSHTRVPLEYVKEGKIVLNLSASATHGLVMDNEWIQFAARFNGVSRQIEVPIAAIAGIFARENGEGIGFEVEDEASRVAPESGADKAPDDDPTPTKPKKSRLQIVK